MILTLPPFPDYDVLQPETIGIRLPASVLLSGQEILLEQQIGVVATSGTAATSATLAVQGGGTSVAQPCCNREDYLRSAGGQARTLTITLTNDFFVDQIEINRGGTLGTLIDNIRSEQQEPYGWNVSAAHPPGRNANAPACTDSHESDAWGPPPPSPLAQAIVQPLLVSSAYVSISSTAQARDTLTFTLPAVSSYSIFIPETIRVSVPPAAVLSRNLIEAHPLLFVRATPGTPAVNGSLFDNPVESTLQNGVSTLLVTVAGDRWIEALSDPESVAGRAAATRLIQAFSSGGSEPNASSWNAEVTPLALSFNESIVQVLNNETVQISLPRIGRYDAAAA